MRWTPSETWSPIGLDIGGHYVKAAQLRSCGGAWGIEAGACFPRAASGAELDRRQVRRIRDVLSRQGFKGTRVVLAVPPAALLTAMLELPPRSSGAPLEQIARAELARIYKRDARSIEVSCWDLPGCASTEGSTTVMAASCPHDDAKRLLRIFENTGLSVEALDVHTCAIARACRPVQARPGALTAILDIGWSATQLAILHEGVIVYEEALTGAGIKVLHLTLARQLGLETEAVNSLLSSIGRGPDVAVANSWKPFQAVRGAIAAHCRTLAQEARTAFANVAYQYPGVAVERVLLVGGGAAIAGLARQLATEFNVDVRAVAATNLLDCPPPLREQCQDAGLAMAIGLAQFSES